MFGALIYLRLMSLANWIRWRAKRLRQPKYLVGTLVGGAYFYFFFFRGFRHAHVSINRPPAGAPISLPVEWHPAALAIGAVGLLVVLTFMWVVPTGRAALGFSEAEIAFLFPAPVTRRTLVHFRLLSAQIRSLTGGLVMAVISNRWSFLGGNALTHAFGWWFIFSFLNLHYNGASFTLTRLADRGVQPWGRRALVLLVVVAVVAITWWRLPIAVREPPLNDGAEKAFSTWIVTLTSAPPLGWLLWPARLALGPFLAPSTSAFLRTLAPALIVIGLHYLWVVQAVVSFEDASIEQTQKRAARIAAWRSGERRFGARPTKGRAAPFRLADRGRPELAFLWKNLLSTWPYFNLRVFGVLAVVIAVGVPWIGSQPVGRVAVTVLAAIGAYGGAYLLIIGPQFFRQDIRSDLINVDLLKTYPLAGWQIVLGEVLTPSAILTGIVWLALLIFALTVGGSEMLASVPSAVRLAGILGVAVLIPPIAMLQLLVPNAAALVFPGWFQATRTRGGGIEVMGQRMIFFLAQLIAIIVLLLPPAAITALLLLGIHFLVWLTGMHFSIPLMLEIAIAAIAILVVLIGELALGFWWLGGRFEKIDIAAELRS
jgi:ABC-2 type transport system permease protein